MLRVEVAAADGVEVGAEPVTVMRTTSVMVTTGRLPDADDDAALPETEPGPAPGRCVRVGVAGLLPS